MTSRGQPARSANWNLPNAITVVRILMAPVFFWLLLADGGADGAMRWWAAVLFIVAISTDWVDGWHRALARTRHRPRQDPRPDRRQAAHERGARVPVDPRRAAVVDHDRDRGARGGHHGLAVRRARPRQRRARVVGRQAQDARAGVAISLALLPLWTVVGDWILWVNWASHDPRGGPHGLVGPAVRARRVRALAREHAATPRDVPDATSGCARPAPIRRRADRRAHPARPAHRGRRVAHGRARGGELTRIPGASLVVSGGVVAYDTAIKHSLLGVTANCWREGAVHPEVARQMADGVRERAGDRRAPGRPRYRDDRRGRAHLAGRTSAGHGLPRHRRRRRDDAARSSSTATARRSAATVDAVLDAVTARSSPIGGGSDCRPRAESPAAAGISLREHSVTSGEVHTKAPVATLDW